MTLRWRDGAARRSKGGFENWEAAAVEARFLITYRGATHVVITEEDA